jgi:hypothetical protein
MVTRTAVFSTRTTISGGDISENQVESRVMNAIKKLRSRGVFNIEDEDGGKYVTVEELDN